nr:hypothetical protein [Tanacetum cinerariifolium]
TGTLSSLQHLAKDFSFGYLFFNDKPSEADNEKTTVETEAESMVSVIIQQDTVAIPPMTTLVSKAVDEIVTDAVDWAIQAPLRNRFRDLPETDMKEILHQRMWETNSYKAHEDHMMLYEALKKSMNYDHTDELLKDLAEARKKKKKRRDSPKTPPGSPPHQAPLPPPPAGPSRTLGSPGAFGSSQVPPPPPPPPSTNQEDRPATPEPAWYILSSDPPVPTNNWAFALASTYTPSPENLLLAHALSISKMKVAYYPDVGLEQMVPDQMCIEEECKHTSKGDCRAVRTHIRILSIVRIEVFSMYGQRVEDFQLGIESYQTQLNLTKPRWDATGFEYKHDFTIIDSPRVVTIRDKYGVQMIMRFNEIYKFSDGTLHQINEAL